MCGRFVLKRSPEALAHYFAVSAGTELPQFAPRYNIPPSTDIPVIRHSPQGQRVMHLLRWGLVPNWAKDPTIGAKLNNARGETVAEKPSFRDAYQRRRCLIPADGFYEWQSEGKHKQPWFISLRNGDPLALGGLWESWRTPEGGILRSVCVVTTTPNEVMAPIHDRMPVIVPPERWQDWLHGPATAIEGLLAPYADAAAMQAWPVDKRVSKTAEDDAGLVEGVEIGRGV